MPRLSIIIPHRNHDARLEASILSVLENRPEDSEVIVVHNGSYADPYNLADEVLVIEGEPRANCLQLLNAGTLAACAPVVCTLLDGVTVPPDWAEEPLAVLESSEVNVVSVATRTAGAKRPTFGLSAKALHSVGDLQRGRVELENAAGVCGGPQMSCGFYRKKALRSVGGWNERLDVHVADMDMAWMLEALGISVTCIPTTEVHADKTCVRTFTNNTMKQLAALAVAYDITAGGASNAVGDLLRGCMGGSISLSVAWASGVMSGRATDTVKARIACAAEQWERESQPKLKVYQQGEHVQAPRRYAA